MKEKILTYFKTNYIPYLFAFAAILIELTAVFVTSGKFYIRSPWLYFTILAAFTFVQFFIPSNKIRHVYSSIVLALFFACDLVFVVIYDMTGTIFDFSMFKLRSDAMAIVEKVQINFAFVAVSGIILSSFIVFGRIPAAFVPKPTITFKAKIVVPCLLSAMIIMHSTLVFFSVKKEEDDVLLLDKLYEKNESVYSDKGVIGNFASELYQGLFKKTEAGDLKEIEDFIYKKVSDDNVPRFGHAKGYNVVTILAESFEWFSFMRDESAFPNGHKADEQILRQLYPNLYEFYDHSVAMTNFHSREKTDISENLSVIGNYPLDYYLNYDYPQNNIAYSLPNVMDDLYGVSSVSFHNGTNTFYNRNVYLPGAVGFDSFVSSEQMAGEFMTDYTEVNELNLDSEMIAACKEQMFPTDRRFNTYITTITTHGQYSYRENLEKYYDIIDSYGILPLSDGLDTASQNANTFRYYVAAAMELDRAVGTITDYLDEKGLTDNTLIVIFGDHNTYYQSLSNYVKDIYLNTETDKNVTDLYRVPLMIKIGKGEESTVTVDKFTCTADILPTIMSLLGIRYYENLYYGHSVFSDEESVLYSRAYDVFMTDKIYFSTLNNIKYISPEVDKTYYDGIEQRSIRLLEKISFVNRIFAGDFFRGAKEERFIMKMREINGLV